MSVRLLLALAATAVGLCLLIGSPLPTPIGLETWLRQDLALPTTTVECVTAEVGDSPIPSGTLRSTTRLELQLHGLTAVPGTWRQLVGDIIIACSVDTS